MNCEIIISPSEIGFEIGVQSTKDPLYVDSRVEKFLRTIPVSSKWVVHTRISPCSDVIMGVAGVSLWNMTKELGNSSFPHLDFERLTH